MNNYRTKSPRSYKGNKWKVGYFLDNMSFTSKIVQTMMQKCANLQKFNRKNVIRVNMPIRRAIPAIFFGFINDVHPRGTSLLYWLHCAIDVNVDINCSEQHIERFTGSCWLGAKTNWMYHYYVYGYIWSMLQQMMTTTTNDDYCTHKIEPKIKKMHKFKKYHEWLFGYAYKIQIYIFLKHKHARYREKRT